jgi:hypothetical protein
MPAFESRQRAAKAKLSGFAGSEGANSKSAAPDINRHLRKTRGCESRVQERWGHGSKCAPNVSHAMQPTILNFKGKKNTSRPKHPENFRERAILQLAGTQVVKHQDRDGRRKARVGKRKRCRIGLNHCCIGTVQAGAKCCGKCVVVLKTRHAQSPQRQFLGCRAWTRAQF